jgi:hypothetical protein
MRKWNPFRSLRAGKIPGLDAGTSDPQSISEENAEKLAEVAREMDDLFQEFIAQSRLAVELMIELKKTMVTIREFNIKRASLEKRRNVIMGRAS